jgi:hypothetical protein
MTTARQRLISLQETPYYHAISGQPPFGMVNNPKKNKRLLLIVVLSKQRRNGDCPRISRCQLDGSFQELRFLLPTVKSPSNPEPSNQAVAGMGTGWSRMVSSKY